MWNKTITLYNKLEDNTTGHISWYRHVLKNCFFKATKRSANVGNTQKNSGDYIIRIPQLNNFLSAAKWLEITDNSYDKFITLQGGDLIVLGDVSDEIDEYTPGQRSSDLVNRYAALGSLFISSVNINTDLPGAHYLVRG